jgi:hypothetical protein
MRTGERFIGSHGGDFGDPLARKPERLRDDVADGLLSGKTALRDYGLVADAGGEIDEVKTARVHAEWPPRAAKRRPVIASRCRLNGTGRIHLLKARLAFASGAERGWGAITNSSFARRPVGRLRVTGGDGGFVRTSRGSGYSAGDCA